MRKHFVLDTNILLHDPDAIFGFDDNCVWIPIVVIEEVDTFKKDGSELGRNAREVARHLDALRRLGSLTDGVVLKNGGMLKVVMTEVKLPEGFHMNHVADDRILSTALHVRDTHPGVPVILVTLDTNLRIRANVLGIEAEDFDTRGIQLEDLYPAVTTVKVDDGLIGTLFNGEPLALPEEAVGLPWYENEYVMVQDSRSTALARIDVANQLIAPIRNLKNPVWGIRPRNREQHFALDACLRPDIHVVTLVGKAGTGKTLLALAAGLQSVAEEEGYARLLVSRPIFPMGRDIGYLPGNVDQKLKPWMQPIHDNVDFLVSLNQRTKKGTRGVEDLVRQGVMEVEPLTYIRGRSIASQYMIVDEAQNLTPHEIKTILTRAGEGTKVVFTGDPFQIDNPYVDSISNGLTYLIDRFRGERIAANITLRKGERSALAELAANRL
ncbi:MAG: PhoH family protein [Deltaproteobacteria bacterium]|nr:MAG: PhoH family protein [Deltaproteobacteria bacterium]